MPTAPIQIREARPEDDVAIGELLIESFVSTYARKMPEVVVTERRKQELRAVAEKRAVAHVLVAEENGRVVGTVAVWPPGARGSEAWIEGAADLRHLAVHPQAQKRGVAAALLDAAEAWAWQVGALGICLHVRHGAIGVARLYEARGYERRPEGDLDLRPEILLDAYFRPASR